MGSFFFIHPPRTFFEEEKGFSIQYRTAGTRLFFTVSISFTRTCSAKNGSECEQCDKGYVIDFHGGVCY
jgi:hypothetical protein